MTTDAIKQIENSMLICTNDAVCVKVLKGEGVFHQFEPLQGTNGTYCPFRTPQFYCLATKDNGQGQGPEEGFILLAIPAAAVEEALARAFFNRLLDWLRCGHTMPAITCKNPALN